MTTNPSAGLPITAAQADLYLKKYIEIRENLQKKIGTVEQSSALSPEAEKDINTFYSSDVNAFIFSKDLIESFFKDKDENGNPQKNANFLMVILSAKYEGDDMGKPTIVVAGVNKDEYGNCYKALDITYAAVEQPPTEELTEFPETD